MQNRLLAAMAPDDFDAVAQQLERVNLPLHTVLVEPGLPIPFVHFIEEGIASVIVRSPEGMRVEAGLIGRESLVSPMLALGADRVAHANQIQMKGWGHRIPTPIFIALMEERPALKGLVLRAAHVFFTQVAYTALSNAVHHVDERLARWLLMSHDRATGDDLPLTHEFLSVMLAVRRPSVTNALHVLEGNGFIQSERGYVVIRNRAGLEEFAGDAYGLAEAEYRRLIGRAI